MEISDSNRCWRMLLRPVLKDRVYEISDILVVVKNDHVTSN
jgi:hypothetical protein